MSETSVTRRFSDELADDHHLIHADGDGSVRRQGRALDALPGRAGAAVLDCSCGIGTPAAGLARHGHEVTGTDLSPRAAARAAREAALREVTLRTAAADMRRLPFPDARFDAVVCADNSLPHLLTAQDVHTALTEMRRVLRPGGRLLLGTRPCDDLLRTGPNRRLPRSTGPWAERSAPSPSGSGTGTRRRALRPRALPAPAGGRAVECPGPRGHLLGARPGPSERARGRRGFRGPRGAAAPGIRFLLTAAHGAHGPVGDRGDSSPRSIAPRSTSKSATASGSSPKRSR